MTVVDITQWYSPTSGGIRTYLHQKALWAQRMGRAHAVVVPGRRDGRDTVGATPFLRLRGHTPSRGWGYRIILDARRVLRAVDELEPTVVVVHDAMAFPRSIARWAAARRVPLAMLCHSDLSLAAVGLPPGLRGMATAALGATQRRALRVPRLVLVASRVSCDRVAPHTDARVVVSPLGVDVAAFRAARVDVRLRAHLAPPGHAVLLYAGRVSSEKRVDLLPGMLAHVAAPATLVIAGTGAAQDRLRRLAARAGVGDRVHMLGHVDDPTRLATLMATADCFVHPNPNEPFGLCPIEALAARCRVVVPAGSGTAEALAGRGAVVVPPGDARALAAGVREALAGARPDDDLADLSWERTFALEWGTYAGLEREAACA